MSEEARNIELLKKYLLGSLSDEETARLDELSFTDEDFAENLKAAENDLVDAFARGELCGETLEKFEKNYLASPLRREKVEFARAFQNFAKRENTELREINAAENSERKSAGFFAALAGLISGKKSVQIGFAAATITVFLLGVFWLAVFRRDDPANQITMQITPTPLINSSPENLAPPPQNGNENAAIQPPDENTSNVNLTNENSRNSNASKNSDSNKPETRPARSPAEEKPVSNPLKPVIASFTLAPPLRGGSRIPLFPVPKDATQIAVGLQIETDDYENYHVTLTNETGDINLWRRGGLKSKRNVLNVGFPAKLLQNGFYSLTVSGINENGEAEIIANYPFRVMMK